MNWKMFVSEGSMIRVEAFREVCKSPKLKLKKSVTSWKKVVQTFICSSVHPASNPKVLSNRDPARNTISW